MAIPMMQPLSDRLVNPQRRFGISSIGAMGSAIKKDPSGPLAQRFINSPGFKPDPGFRGLSGGGGSPSIGASNDFLKKLIQMMMGGGGGGIGMMQNPGMNPNLTASPLMGEGLNNTSIGGSDDFLSRYRMI